MPSSTTAPSDEAPTVAAASAPAAVRTAPRRPSLLRRLGGGGLTVVMSVMLVIFVAMTVLRFTGGELLAVRTGSMAPMMSPGDLLISRDVDPRTVRRGDVITFRVPDQDNTLVTHRVTSVQDDGNTFTTKGDANEIADPFTTKADDVLGRKWFVLPGIGRAVVFLASPPSTALLLGIPAAIYISQTLADRRRAAAVRAAVASATVTETATPTAAEPPTDGLIVLPAAADTSAPAPAPPAWLELGDALGPCAAVPLALPASALPPEVAERLGTSWVLVTPLHMSMAGLAAGAVGTATAASAAPVPGPVDIPSANPF